jgi:ribosomal-protein-alanine N-acetyltransferase
MGSKLTCALVGPVRQRKVTRVFLEVRESNAAARALYEKCGFQISGRRKSYYSDPAEDAVLYFWVP